MCEKADRHIEMVKPIGAFFKFLFETRKTYNSVVAADLFLIRTLRDTSGLVLRIIGLLQHQL
jgi:hypothetical protein